MVLPLRQVDELRRLQRIEIGPPAAAPGPVGAFDVLCAGGAQNVHRADPLGVARRERGDHHAHCAHRLGIVAIRSRFIVVTNLVERARRVLPRRIEEEHADFVFRKTVPQEFGDRLSGVVLLFETSRNDRVHDNSS
jgi:hypothetical protein